MTDKQKQVFTKCLSEAEVREGDSSWKSSKFKCNNPHKYTNVDDLKSFLKDEHKPVLTLLEHIVKLTVLIKIPIKSEKATEDIVFGTGFIQRVRKITKNRKSENETSESDKLCKIGVLTISTVHHVLYPEIKKEETTDFNEATIWIDYDSETGGHREAKTFTIVESDKDINTYDWCSFECTTEDIALVDKLAECISKLEDEQLIAYSYYKQLKHKDVDNVNKGTMESKLLEDDGCPVTEAELVTDLIVLVGHPHGGPKQVSVGKQKRPKAILKQVRDQQEWCCYYHDAETCTGSSGSPVFIFGQPLCGYGYWFGHSHSHSGKCLDGLKVTSIGVDHIEMIQDRSNEHNK